MKPALWLMFTSFEVITLHCSVFKDQLRLYNTVLWRLDYNNRFTISCQQLFLIFFAFVVSHEHECLVLSNMFNSIFYFQIKSNPQFKNFFPEENVVMRSSLVAISFYLNHNKRKKSTTCSGTNLTTVSVCGGICRALPFALFS